MTYKELKQHYDIILDCWRFLHEYHDVKDTDQYWDEVVRRSESIYERYKTDFARKAVLLIVCELEKSAPDGAATPFQGNETQ